MFNAKVYRMPFGAHSLACPLSRCALPFAQRALRHVAQAAGLTLLDVMVTALPVVGSAAQAAGAQYIMVHNTLSATADGKDDLTTTPVFLQFYNGAARPCFTSYVNYGAMVDLSTGVRSPCVAPVDHIAITPLPTPSDLICYTGGETTAVTSSASALTVTVQSLVGPVFDRATGEVITPGTAQIVISDF